MTTFIHKWASSTLLDDNNKVTQSMKTKPLLHLRDLHIPSYIDWQYVNT